MSCQCVIMSPVESRGSSVLLWSSAAHQIPLAVNKPIGGGTGKPDAMRLHGESDAWKAELLTQTTPSLCVLAVKKSSVPNLVYCLSPKASSQQRLDKHYKPGYNGASVNTRRPWISIKIPKQHFIGSRNCFAWNRFCLILAFNTLPIAQTLISKRVGRLRILKVVIWLALCIHTLLFSSSQTFEPWHKVLF